jgi:hypothetical protein
MEIQDPYMACYGYIFCLVLINIWYQMILLLDVKTRGRTGIAVGPCVAGFHASLFTLKK